MHTGGWLKIACAIVGVAEVEGALGRIGRGGVEGDALDAGSSPQGSRIQGGQGGSEVIGGEKTGATAWIKDGVVEVIEGGLIQRRVPQGQVITDLVAQSSAAQGGAIQSEMITGGAIADRLTRDGVTARRPIQSRMARG